MVFDLLKDIARTICSVFEQVRNNCDLLPTAGPQGSRVLFELVYAMFAYNCSLGFDVDDGGNQQISLVIFGDKASVCFQSWLQCLESTRRGNG